MAFKYDIRAMLRKFGVVTVMDVKAYQTVLFNEDVASGTNQEAYEKGEWDAIATLWGRQAPASGATLGVAETTATVKPVFTLDTLKIANINQEGPTKTITGGQNADTLLKYGKTLTMEMQEALGRYDVLENIYGVNFSDNHQIASFTDRFPGELTLVGTTFVIDQKTGAKQPIHIIIPRFLGDGIFNLTQDAEGDATVFDLNGNVLKFEGGASSAEAVAAEGWVNCTGTGTGTSPACAGWDGKLYGTGADNEFYFMCTKEIYDFIAQKGYREAAKDTTGPVTPVA